MMLYINETSIKGSRMKSDKKINIQTNVIMIEKRII